MSFNTGNPIGSISEEDCYDNMANLDQAMNSTEPTWRDRFNVEKPTIDTALKSAGFMPAGFDFVTGGTLQPGDRNKAVYNPAPNGDNNWYRWNGVFPKEITPNSQPNPKDENNWVPVIIKTDVVGREALRRTYQEVGLNLVEGSFETGAIITSTTDVVLHEKTGKCFSGPIGEVPKGTNPLSSSFLDFSSNTLRNIQAGNSGHFATDNRTGYQRNIHFIGDSHTYGQGARGDTGPFARSTHATRYGATTWSTLLKNELYRSWNTFPAQYNSSDALISGQNAITGIKMLEAVQGAKHIDATPFNHRLKELHSQGDRFDIGEITMLNYNTAQGFYGPLASYVTYTPDISMATKCAKAYSFTPDPTRHGYFDGNGRFGVLNNVMCVDGQIGSRAFITCSFSNLPILAGTVFYIRFETDIISSHKLLNGYTQVVCEEVFVTNTGHTQLAFSYPNGATLSVADMQDFARDLDCRVYLTTAKPPIVEVPIDSPKGLIGISLITGYCGLDTQISIIPHDGGALANETMMGDHYYAADYTSDQRVSIDVIVKKTNETMELYNGPLVTWNGIGGTNQGELVINTSRNADPGVNAVFSEFPFWLLFGVRSTGILRLKPKNISKYTESEIGFHIAVRGVIDTDMTKIMTHGFGCHSMGDLIGRSRDVCGHDAVAFDHVPMILKCEEISTPYDRMIVHQAPLVNEYLRQTPIAMYKADLTEFYNKMFNGAWNHTTAKKVIIFTGSGQMGLDDYLGPITGPSTISYSMYRQATKEWAKEAGVTYVDAALVQKRLIENGDADGIDFLMKDGDNYDSNHPNNYAHRLWFEALKDITLRKFQ